VDSYRKGNQYFSIQKNDQVRVDRQQFPIVPAEGITIHKSQGATYKKVAIHLKLRMSRLSLYVACSPAMNASGLFILGCFKPPKEFNEIDAVKIELNQLRHTKRLSVFFHNFIDLSDIKIVFHNIQGLSLHIPDVIND